LRYQLTPLIGFVGSYYLGICNIISVREIFEYFLSSGGLWGL
jgi:hypothetical protein